MLLLEAKLRKLIQDYLNPGELCTDGAGKDKPACRGESVPVGSILSPVLPHPDPLPSRPDAPVAPAPANAVDAGGVRLHEYRLHKGKDTSSAEAIAGSQSRLVWVEFSRRTRPESHAGWLDGQPKSRCDVRTRTGVKAARSEAGTLLLPHNSISAAISALGIDSGGLPGTLK
jgi:hypothetical protein